MSARHRRANVTRRALYEAQHATHEALASLASPPTQSHSWTDLTCVTEEQADRIARLAEKSAAIAREVDMLSEELLPALRAYEQRRSGDA